MTRNGDSGRKLDAAIAVFVVALLLFSSPLTRLWSAPGNPWYTPYLLWLAIIALAWMVQALRSDDGV